MSSAILYLAIVAIWAVVLVPRWLRPRTAAPHRADHTPEQPAEPQEEPATPEAGADTEASDPQAAPSETTPESTPHIAPPPARRSAAERRADVLRARRRMLAMLIGLTAGAVGLAGSGLAASWVIIPPAVLLAGLVVLLREAARSDAERTFDAEQVRRATLASTSRAAGEETGEVSESREQVPASPQQAPAAAGMDYATGPLDFDTTTGAEVIDISGRISDQVYDQYSDAADRAVGD